jgi:hypothetical protein
VPIFTGVVAPNVPAIVEPELFRAMWTSPQGRDTDLSDVSWGNAPQAIILLPGSLGLDMPEFSQYVDTSPGFDGELSRGFRTEARDISLPILMHAPNRALFRVMRNDLFADLNPRLGAPGTLSIMDWNGTNLRSIECFYKGGLEGAIDDNEQGHCWAKYVLEFRAGDPYWLGDTITPRPLTSGDETGWLPLMPIRVTASQILGNATITNHGQSVAYPTYIITGPATAINLINNTTGESLSITYELEADDTLSINTRQGRKSVVLNAATEDETNLFPYLSNDSTLWALAPGVNDVTFTLVGQAPETTLQFSYQERYLAAW